MKVGLSGSSGQLGTSILSEIASLNLQGSGGIKVVEAVRIPRELDLSNQTQVKNFLVSQEVQAIVNCAAWTDVDAAENHGEAVFLINARVPEIMARVAAGLDVPFVHISSEAVFSGRKTSPYTEQDPPDPISTYGRSKLAAEQAVLNANETAVVLRTSWLYSRNSASNFPSRLRRQLELSDVRIPVVSDIIGNPTPSELLAKAVLAVLRSPPKGDTYHVCTTGGVSKFLWARHLTEIWGYDPTRLKETDSSRFQSPAPRSTRVDLKTTKFQALGLIDLPDWLTASERHWQE